MIDHTLRDQLKDVHAYALTIYQRDDLYALDLDGFARNVAWAADRGVRVFVVAGGTGENDALAPPERLALAECALATVGERALVVPTLPGNLGEAAQLAPRYEALGLRVALAMAPYTRHEVPADPEGVYQYYEALGARSGLVLMPYNTQGWSAELFERLAAVEPIAAIKDPCVDPHPLFRAIKRLGDRFVWIGNKRHDPGVLHFRFQAGIEGFTAGFVNFAPQLELALFAAAQRRDWPLMIELQERLAPLERLRTRFDDAGMLKATMELMGLVGGAVRPPRMDVPPAGRAVIKKELQRLGVLGA